MINNVNPYPMDETHVREYDSADTWQIWHTPDGYEVWYLQEKRETKDNMVDAWLWLQATRRERVLHPTWRTIEDTRDYIGMPNEQ